MRKHAIQRYVELIRPSQWIKNIFVFTGLIFSEQLSNAHLLFNTTIAALSFAMVSSSIYILNDIIDQESDKHHPQKKNRPLATGDISLKSAVLLMAFFCFTGLLVGFLLSKTIFFLLSCYIIINILYCIKLKHLAIIDVFCISAGFMLRILVGTLGVGIAPSKWLLLCGLMITLFLGFTKRRAELAQLKENAGSHRKVLQHYELIFLDQVITICATGVILGYSLYTMSPDTIAVHHTDNLLFTVPFVIFAIFRYIYIIIVKNGAGDPTKELLKDKHILVSVLCWFLSSLYILNSSNL